MSSNSVPRPNNARSNLLLTYGSPPVILIHFNPNSLASWIAFCRSSNVTSFSALGGGPATTQQCLQAMLHRQVMYRYKATNGGEFI